MIRQPGTVARRVLSNVAVAAVFWLSGCGGGQVKPGGGSSAVPADLPGEEVIAVEADGEANVIPDNKLSTRDMAVSNAQRNAVEKALGVLVTGQMVVSQARLIEDQVFSKTAGYLKHWEVVSEKEEDGLYRVRIKARVKLGDVRKDVDGLGMLIHTKKVGNPRVMVLIDEQVDGKPSAARTIETGLAKALLEKGYKLVDLEQLAEIKGRDATARAARGDEAAAAELGKRFGAEVSLVGSVNAKKYTAGGEDALGGMVSYRGRLSVKAVKTSSGQVVLADSREGAGMDIDDETAAIRCLAQLAEGIGIGIAEKLAPALWEGAEVQLAVAGVKDFAALQGLVGAVRSADGVRNVITRTFADGAAVLDVELAGGNANTLAANLEGRSRVPLEIREIAAYRIDAAIKPSGGQ